MRETSFRENLFITGTLLLFSWLILDNSFGSTYCLDMYKSKWFFYDATEQNPTILIALQILSTHKAHFSLNEGGTVNEHLLRKRLGMFDANPIYKLNRGDTLKPTNSPLI